MILFNIDFALAQCGIASQLAATAASVDSSESAAVVL